MKILIIPDVHGSHEWEVAKERYKEADYVVFLGDFFDSFHNVWDDQGENFRNICDFIREDTEHRKLLIGNHDFSYLSQTSKGALCSGHQDGRYGDADMSKTIKALLLSAKDILQLAFEADGWVFSHAGFSKTSVNSFIKKLYPMYTEVQKSQVKDYFIDSINKLFRERLDDYGSDTKKKWLTFDKCLDWNGHNNPSGDEPSQFCLWIRPHSLLEDSAYKKQVVGHTEYCFGDFQSIKNSYANIILADSRNHRVYEVFDTENPPEAITEPEFHENNKKLEHDLTFAALVINGIEQKLGPLPEKEKIKILEDKFDGKGPIYYELFFKGEN